MRITATPGTNYIQSNRVPKSGRQLKFINNFLIANKKRKFDNIFSRCARIRFTKFAQFFLVFSPHPSTNKTRIFHFLTTNIQLFKNTQKNTLNYWYYLCLASHLISCSYQDDRNVLFGNRCVIYIGRCGYYIDVCNAIKQLICRAFAFAGRISGQPI